MQDDDWFGIWLRTGWIMKNFFSQMKSKHSSLFHSLSLTLSHPLVSSNNFRLKNFSSGWCLSFHDDECSDAFTVYLSFTPITQSNSLSHLLSHGPSISPSLIYTLCLLHSLTAYLYLFHSLTVYSTSFTFSLSTSISFTLYLPHSISVSVSLTLSLPLSLTSSSFFQHLSLLSWGSEFNQNHSLLCVNQSDIFHDVTFDYQEFGEKRQKMEKKRSKKKSFGSNGDPPSSLGGGTAPGLKINHTSAIQIECLSPMACAACLTLTIVQVVGAR